MCDKCHTHPCPPSAQFPHLPKYTLFLVSYAFFQTFKKAHTINSLSHILVCTLLFPLIKKMGDDTHKLTMLVILSVQFRGGRCIHLFCDRHEHSFPSFFYLAEPKPWLPNTHSPGLPPPSPWQPPICFLSL